MTKAGYRRLKAVWVIGSVAMLASVVAGWLKLIPFGWLLLIILVLGGPAAFAAWILRDQNYQELPE